MFGAFYPGQAYPGQGGLPAAATVWTDAVTETAAATDSASATIIYAAVSIAESVATSESPTAAFIATAAGTASVAATESPVSNYATPAAATESVAAGEAPAAGTITSAAAAEAVASSDSPSAAFTTLAAAVETVSSSDLSASGALITDSVGETAGSGESSSVSFLGAGVIAESAAAGESTVSALNAVASITETTASSEVPSAIFTAASVITENAASSDISGAAASLPVDIIETIGGAEAAASSILAASAIEETAINGESSSYSIATAATAAEAAAASEASSAIFTALSNIAEAVASSDAATVLSALVSINETAIADESIVAVYAAVVNQSETIVSSETPVAAELAISAVTEVAAAGENSLPAVATPAAVAESAAAGASPAANYVTSTVIGESAAAGEAPSAVFIAAGAVVESTAATESDAATFLTPVNTVENAAASEASNRTMITPAAGTASAAASESALSGFAYPVIAVETVAAGETENAAYLTVGAVVETVATVDGGIFNPGNTALLFNGTTGKVALPGIALSAAGFTVEAWIKKSSYGGQRSFFSNRGGSGKVYAGVTTLPFIYLNSATPPASYGTTTLSPGVSTHVVFANNGLFTYCYVNGKIDNTTSQVLGDMGTSVSSAIGWDPVITTEFWDGVIDGARVYNGRCLTAAEVAARYVGREISLTGLVGWWRFSEGSGIIALDSSGIGNHGVLVGDPVYVPGLDLDGSTTPGKYALDFAGSPENWLLQTENTENAAWAKSNLLASNTGETFLAYGLTTLTLFGGLALHYFNQGFGGLPDNADIWAAIYVDVTGLTTKNVFAQHVRKDANYVLSTFQWTGPRTVLKTAAPNGFLLDNKVEILGDYKAILWTKFNLSMGATNPQHLHYVGQYGNYSGDGEFVKVSRAQFTRATNGNLGYVKTVASSAVPVFPYVVVSTNNGLNLGNTDVSFEWWFLPTAAPIGTVNLCLWEKSAGSAFNGFTAGFAARMRTGGVVEFIRSTGGNPNPFVLRLNANPFVIAGQKIHAVLTWNNITGVLSVYKNGALANSITYSGVDKDPFTDSFPLYIGYGGNGPWTNGPIDGFRVYTRELGLTEIAQRYAGSYPDETSVAGWWRFNEGSGVVALDSSVNRNNGALINSPVYVPGLDYDNVNSSAAALLPVIVAESMAVSDSIAAMVNFVATVNEAIAASEAAIALRIQYAAAQEILAADDLRSASGLFAANVIEQLVAGDDQYNIALFQASVEETGAIADIASARFIATASAIEGIFYSETYSAIIIVFKIDDRYVVGTSRIFQVFIAQRELESSPHQEPFEVAISRVFEVVQRRIFEAYDMEIFPEKQSQEKIVLTFNYSGELAAGETITGNPTIAISMDYGRDPNPAAIQNGTPIVDVTGTKVLFPCQGGLPGKRYRINITMATSNQLKVLAIDAVLPIAAV